MNKYNHDKLYNLMRSVLTINMIHLNADIAKAFFEQCDLLSKLNVCIDVKIMLTQNLWIERDLINDSIKYIKNMMWFTNADIKKNHSLTFLITVNQYNDSELFTCADSKMIILIFSATHEWENKKDDYSHY